MAARFTTICIAMGSCWRSRSSKNVFGSTPASTSVSARMVAVCGPLVRKLTSPKNVGAFRLDMRKFPRIEFFTTATLEEEKEVEAVDVCVRDEGTGIAPEILERVFDPFFTTKPGGSGLGLATVHRIVEEHGGSLRVESQLGSGTAVWLRLPRAEDAT